MTTTPIVPRRVRHHVALLAAAAAVAGGCAKGSANATPRGATAVTAAPPGDAVKLYARGVKAYEGGDRTRAVADLEAAVAADPSLIMARERLGDAYKDAGQYDRAMAQYDALTRLDPYGATGWYKLGVSQHLQGRLPAAAASYGRALKLDRADWKSRMNLGLVQLADGHSSDAVGNLKQATDGAPNRADAWANYGAALDAAGSYPEAEAAYRKALQLQPDQPAIELNLATNLLAQKKPVDAAGLLEQVVKAEDSPLARRRLGDAFLAQQKYAEAEAQYDLALKGDPKQYGAMNGIAAVKFEQYKADTTANAARKQEAVAAWRRSLAANPNQPQIAEAVKANEK
jgi:tetratricopeptide (TPR) repeat protein